MAAIRASRAIYRIQLADDPVRPYLVFAGDELDAIASTPVALSLPLFNPGPILAVLGMPTCMFQQPITSGGSMRNTTGRAIWRDEPPAALAAAAAFLPAIASEPSKLLTLEAQLI